MPSELRLIVFTREEVTQALIALDRISRQGWPEGQVLGLRYDDGEEMRVHLDVLSSSGVRESVAIGTATVAAALIGFCREKKIPLPRQARKSLQLAGDQVALRLSHHAPEAGVDAAT